MMNEFERLTKPTETFLKENTPTREFKTYNDSKYEKSLDFLSAIQGKDNRTPFEKSDRALHENLSPDEIFGLPDYMENVDGIDMGAKAIQSNLIIELFPGWPNYSGLSGDNGINLYDIDLNKGAEWYKKILSAAGVDDKDIRSDVVRFSILNDTSFVDSFANDFSDSQFENFGGSVSEMGGEIRTIVGGNSGREMIRNVKEMAGEGVNKLKKQLKNIPGADNVLNKISEIGSEAANWTDANFDDNSLTGGIIKTMLGSKVDFPMIWRGSSYSPSYSFTVRLYNPDPEDEISYKKTIITPLAHLVAYMCPIADSKFTFLFPLLCKFRCPGIAGLDMAYISNMDIIKGGEANDICFWQRPNIVDIRFTISGLYSTMIAENSDTSKASDPNRPTLKSFLDIMKGYTKKPRTNFEGTDNIGTDGVLTSYLLDESRVIDDSNFNSPIDPDAASRDRVSIEERSRYNEIEERFPSNGVSEGEAEIVDGLTKEQRLANYQTDRDLFQRDRGYLLDSNGKWTIPGKNTKPITTLDRLALRIKNDLEYDEDLLKYFWDNYDLLPADTRALVSDKVPDDMVSNVISREVARVNQNVERNSEINRISNEIARYPIDDLNNSITNTISDIMIRTVDRYI